MLDPRLRYVVAVATAGSFTAGAAAAGVTQSTVTKSIADLEREVGYAIFVRSARGVVLTERGSYFAERAKLLLDDMRNLMDPEARRQNAYSGILRIGVAPASIEWVLIEALVRLRRYHPTIKFDVSGTSFDRMIQQLRTDVVDVGIGMSGAFKAWGDLDSGEFGHLEVLPFVRNGHPLLKMEEVRLADLAAYDFISPSESRPYGERIRDLYLNNGVAWQDRVHVIDYFPGVKRLVATSDAIGVIAAPFGQRPGFRAHFTPLPDTGLFPSGPLAYAYHNKREPKPATRAFIAVLKTAAVTAGHSRRE
ncbi:hypothetical protein GCM10009087_51000 [Sphingomonas oligophenolica]